MEIQNLYNRKIIGQNLEFRDIEKHTQELVLCAHAELSSLINATNYKKHHGNLEAVDRDKILYESVDVLRYVLAIQNLWEITPEEFENVFVSKDVYLNARKRIDDNPWTGQPVAIVDMDDVLVEFRICFAEWLKKEYNLYVDPDSEEYYFITALSKISANPELVFSNFIKQDGFVKLTPIEGAKKFIDQLKSQGYWIQILTARPEENLRCMYNTYQWLDKHGFYYDDIAFSAEKFRWCAKSKYYDSNSIKFAIDDSPKHASEYANHGIKCYVPVKSYNKTVVHENSFFYDNFNKLISMIS